MKPLRRLPLSLSEPLLPLSEVNFLGAGLNRPECLLCTSNGDIYSADGRGGVARSRAFGPQALYQAAGGAEAIRPNGIALQRDGSFLVTNLNDAGGLFRLDRDGRLNEVLREVDGIDLPATNFVLIDDRGRVWVTVSTRQTPRALGYRRDLADGFIVLIDGKKARIVADGLGYANELQLDRRGEHLFVAETFGRRLTRFRIGRFGTLSDPTVIAGFGAGTFPDGLAMDIEDHLWVTSPVSNRIIRVAPDGAQTLILEDSDPGHLAAVEAAYESGSLGREHLDRARSQKLRNLSSLAFGGRNLRTAFLGNLLGERIAFFRAPVMGRPPVHWHFNF
jgi:sugar lactone lactonase YvrE